MRDKRPRVAAAAPSNRAGRRIRRTSVFIVDFNDVAYLDAPFTNNIKQLEQVLDKIDTRGGTSAMRDAISMSIDYAKESGKKSKKVLVSSSSLTATTTPATKHWNSWCARRGRAKC